MTLICLVFFFEIDEEKISGYESSLTKKIAVKRTSPGGGGRKTKLGYLYKANEQSWGVDEGREGRHFRCLG